MGIGTYMVKSRAQNACSDGGGIQLWRLSAELKKEFNVKRFINAWWCNLTLLLTNKSDNSLEKNIPVLDMTQFNLEDKKNLFIIMYDKDVGIK